jgi:hypothetical protein
VKKSREYFYNIPFKDGNSFGKLIALNLRLAKRLLRAIFRLEKLPPKTDIWIKKD